MKTLNKLKLISLFAFISIGFTSLTAQCTYNIYAVDSLNPPSIYFYSNATWINLFLGFWRW
jgi:hypothetical protein